MRRINYEYILIVIILIIAFSIRVYGIDFGLPDLYHPDEINKISIAQNMFKSGDLDPHYFKKPTLFIYLNALLYFPYYWIGHLFGFLHTPNDILAPVQIANGYGHSSMPTTVVMGRLLTCFFATGYILLVFFIGKRLSNKAAVGLLASAMIAISPINVDQSRYIIENSFLVFFQTFVVWASLLILQRGKTSDYLLAGIATGLAVSSKYPGGLIAIVPLFAHFCNQSLKQGLKDHRIYFFLMLIPMVFFATTPYALINYKKFIEDIFFEGHHYSTGHPGMDGNSLFWYLSYAGETAGLIYLLSLFEMVRGVYLRNKSILLLSIFPVVNFVFISSFVVRNDRTFLPLTPMLCILAASFLVYLFSQVNEIENRILRWCCVFGVIALSVISFVQPTVNTFKDSMRLTVIDSRETSKIWVNENLPAGSKIGIEAFSPFIDPSRFAIQSFDLMIENEPEWYLNHGFDYLLFTQDTYGVFYQESSRYKTEVSAYDELFRRFKLVKIFTDGGLEIRLYKVK